MKSKFPKCDSPRLSTKDMDKVNEKLAIIKERKTLIQVKKGGAL